MTETAKHIYKPFTPFNVFKWVIYFLLIVNIYIFFVDDWESTSVLFPEGMMLSDIITGFAATIDTFAWVILILMFELETYILPDEKIVGRLKWTMHTIRFLLYGIIVYAFYGYLSAYFGLSQFAVTDIAGLCSLADGSNSFMTTLNEYELITADNCQSLFSASPLYVHGLESIYADAETFSLANKLAWIDNFNAGTWLLICLVLEIDVRLEIKDKLVGKTLIFSKIAKFILYSILLACAIFWGIDGSFIDFWDAFLWILAFALIELNLFKWHQE